MTKKLKIILISQKCQKESILKNKMNKIDNNSSKNYYKREHKNDSSENEEEGEKDNFSIEIQSIEENINNIYEDSSVEYSFNSPKIHSNKLSNKHKKYSHKNNCIGENSNQSSLNKNNSTIKINQNKSYNEIENIKKANSNTLSEINDCFSKLNDLISKYSLIEVIDIILKLINGIPEEMMENNELFKKINKITNKIKNKNTITIICLSILSSKYSLKENNIQKIKNEQSEDNEKRKESDNDELNSEGYDEFEEKKIELINGFHLKKDLLVFGTHYYNCRDKIYSFIPRTKNKLVSKITAFCSKNNRKRCSAKVIVIANSEKVEILGHHNHDNGISKSFFYSKYPFLKDKKWTHVQIIKGKRKDKVIIQS